MLHSLAWFYIFKPRLVLFLQSIRQAVSQSVSQSVDPALHGVFLPHKTPRPGSEHGLHLLENKSWLIKVPSFIIQKAPTNNFIIDGFYISAHLKSYEDKFRITRWALESTREAKHEPKARSSIQNFPFNLSFSSLFFQTTRRLVCICTLKCLKKIVIERILTRWRNPDPHLPRSNH